MRTRHLTGAAAVIVLAGALPLAWSGGTAPQPPPAVKDARLKFEVNATDGDGGVQLFLDAEPWRQVSVFDPVGRLIYTSNAKGRLGVLGGTELFLESGEPPFTELPLDQLLERFPQGDYRIQVRGIDGEASVGSARLTHDLPDGPRLVSPLEKDGPQDPDATTVRWEPVEAPNGSPIVGYQVLVVQPETGIAALPKITLDVMMPPDATSLAIPPGFLQPATEYEWEVLAIEAGGNQTLSSAVFTTGESASGRAASSAPAPRRTPAR